ncbi:MAG: ATP-binding protein [Cyanobacteria bacterium P01_A01_bin.123]
MVDNRFLEVFNPVNVVNDDRYYVDFSLVTGERVLEPMRRTICLSKPDSFTSQLITGYGGCGKSTELINLKSKLIRDGFYVVYFRFERQLNEVDVRPTDIILLSIAYRVIQSLKRDFEINLEPNFFIRICIWLADVLLGIFRLQLNFEVEREIPKVGKVKISIKPKDTTRNLSKLEFWDRIKPSSNNILDFVNEILHRATGKLKQLNKKGLVVIVDNLDHLDKSTDLSLLEQVFIDRNEPLSQLKCHIIYTLPISLIYSKKYESLKRLGGGIDPKILRIVPVQLRDGSENLEGIKLLKQVILSRAFPHVHVDKRYSLISQLFDNPESLTRLCRISGGKVQKLLEILNNCLQRVYPKILVKGDIEYEIKQYCNRLLFRMTEEERKIVCQILQNIDPEIALEKRELLLYGIQKGLILEYKDRYKGSWFGLDPTFLEIEEFQAIVKSKNSKHE